MIDWIRETAEECEGENQKTPEGADLGGKTPSFISDILVSSVVQIIQVSMFNQLEVDQNSKAVYFCALSENVCTFQQLFIPAESSAHYY